MTSFALFCGDFTYAFWLLPLYKQYCTWLRLIKNKICLVGVFSPYDNRWASRVKENVRSVTYVEEGGGSDWRHELEEQDLG